MTDRRLSKYQISNREAKDERYIVGKLKRFLRYIRSAVPMLIFGLIYMYIFAKLEKTERLSYHVIHCSLDDYIPFSEVFIIPYLGWFVYVGYYAVMLYRRDRKTYHRLCTMLVIGMSVFLVVSAVWPNKLMLRPATMTRSNILTVMVEKLYLSDTPTNVFPSIHVFNTLSVITAMWKSGSEWANRPGLKNKTLFLGILIILSTVFLKQHSLIDVMGAFVMWLACRQIVYEYAFCFVEDTAEEETVYSDV